MVWIVDSCISGSMCDDILSGFSGFSGFGDRARFDILMFAAVSDDVRLRGEGRGRGVLLSPHYR